MEEWRLFRNSGEVAAVKGDRGAGQEDNMASWQDCRLEGDCFCATRSTKTVCMS